MSHSPLFQVLFILQKCTNGKFKLPGVNIKIFSSDIVRAKFDLTLSIMETEKGLIASYDYNSDLFNEKTITGMAEHFQNILTAIVKNTQSK